MSQLLQQLKAKQSNPKRKSAVTDRLITQALGAYSQPYCGNDIHV